MASLKLENISKQFGHVVALSHVSLNIEDGAFCVFLGPSGCGKSTLLQIVAGLETQDQGSVLLDGKVVDHLSPRQRDIAMVFQNYALYPHMTVYENLSFGLRMRSIPKADIRTMVQETARLLDIEHLLTRKPRQLSGGQRQRVAMGRALVRRPQLFLLDEPLSNLDAQLRTHVRLELKRLHRNINTTILYVTHDQVEAMTLGDRVVVLREGKVHQIGRPETIYDKPEDTFVATFVGSPMMNLFKGRVRQNGKHTEFQGPDFALGLHDRARRLVGQTVEVGIRPEDIVSVKNGETGTFLQARVDMLSNVGAEIFIHAKKGESSITLRSPKNVSYHVGQELSLLMDPEKMHIFHNGRRI